MIIIPQNHLIIEFREGLLWINVDDSFLRLTAIKLRCKKLVIYTHIPRHFLQPGRGSGIMMIPRCFTVGGRKGSQRTHVLLPDIVPPYTRYTTKSLLMAAIVEPELISGASRKRKTAKNEAKSNVKSTLSLLAVFNPGILENMDYDDWLAMANQADNECSLRKIKYILHRSTKILHRMKQMSDLAVRRSKFDTVEIPNRERIESLFIRAKNGHLINNLSLINKEIILYYNPSG